jgi:hypothetical protein
VGRIRSLRTKLGAAKIDIAARDDIGGTGMSSKALTNMKGISRNERDPEAKKQRRSS